MIKTGVDGPFSAPAQRFFTFDKSIIIGAGIGVTPFAAVLANLEANLSSHGDPWQVTRTPSFLSLSRTRTLAREQTLVADATDDETEYRGVQKLRKTRPGSYGQRRVDFHWSVRERNQLGWFSDLLNRASDLADHPDSELTLNVHAHITSEKRFISTHIFRYLLDSYRTEQHPYSALTGLKLSAHFGRPNYERILNAFYADMMAQGWTGRVGIFFCGPTKVGEMLADICSILTARARDEGNTMRFIFMNEVFT